MNLFMHPRFLRPILGGLTPLLLVASASVGRATPETSYFPGRPDAIVDLTTRTGIELVKGQWRTAEADLVEIEFNRPGDDLGPTGPAGKTLDLFPKAGATEFDDSSWKAIDPESLRNRRTGGRFAGNWYRIRITLPDKVGSFPVRGSTVLFEVVVDDYAEVWVDGKLPRTLGQVGGSLVGGFNAPNRLVVTRDARPGKTIQLAVFGMNGPLSDPPDNYVWIRSATLDFHRDLPDARPTTALDTGSMKVVRIDPEVDRIVPADARLERVADGFTFTEGPVWAREGFLLFSDPDDNVIYRWAPLMGVSIFRTKSGYTGFDVGEYRQPGSNGLAFDPQGRLTIAEHGNRRVTRLEKNGVLTVLADRYRGKRLNSPNDLVYRSDGTLFFTDPAFGLPGVLEDPRKELSFCGVFRLREGDLELVSDELRGPNGIALSPDERTLYVGNWDEKRKVVLHFEIKPDGSVGKGRVFHDMTTAPGEDAIDGVKVDRAGNVYVSGPGGLWVLSPRGRHLGTLMLPEHPHNFAWGDADGRTLYIAARSGIYRIRLANAGVRS